MSDITLEIAQDSDDAYEQEDTGAVKPAENLERVRGNASGQYRYHSGLRWVSASLPSKGSKITACHISLPVYDTSLDDVWCEIFFQLAAAPGTFTTDAFSITTRPRTPNSVTWHADSLGAGYRDTPSLIVPLQEVVDDYSPSALVALFVPDTTDKYLWWDGFHLESGDVSKIIIEWDEPVAVGRSYAHIIG